MKLDGWRGRHEELPDGSSGPPDADFYNADLGPSLDRVSDSYNRYEIPPERALSIGAGASGALSSLLALEKHESEAAIYLKNLRAEIDVANNRDRMTDADQEAETRKTALLDQVQALRRDVADLAADAAALLPPPEGPSAIVIPRDLPPPRLDLPAPLALAQFQRWYVQGTATHMRGAAQSADQLVRHLGDSDDPNTMNLCVALRDFVGVVRGKGD